MNFFSNKSSHGVILFRGSLVLILFFINIWDLHQYSGAVNRTKATLAADHSIPGNTFSDISNDKLFASLEGEAFFANASNQTGEIPGKQIRFEKLSIEEGLSQSSVSSILQDSKGFLWFGTEDGLNKFDGYEFTIYRHDPDDSSSLSDNSILSIYEDHNQVLWVGTYGRGLNRFDRDKENFIHYRQNPDDPDSLSHDSVTSISNDDEGNLWIGTGNGVNRFDPDSQKFVQYKHDPEDLNSLGHNYVVDIHLDKEGSLWIGTFGGGLNRYDPSTNSFTRYRHDIINPNKISSDYVTSISEDLSGNLWIGTGTGGLNFFDKETEKFFYYRYDSKVQDITGQNFISSVVVDSEGKIWIGTNGAGIEILDPTTGHFQYINHDQGDPSSISSNNVREIFKDPSGIIWVGTFGGGVNRFDPVTARFNHYRHISSNPNSLPANHVSSLAEDPEGNLWIGIFGGGVNYFDRDNGRMINYKNNQNDSSSLSSNDVWYVYVDQLGEVWIGTIGGGLNRFSPISKNFTHYRHDPDDPDSLSIDSVNVIFEDREGLLWIGTTGGGLDRFDRITGKFFHNQHDPEDPTSLSNNNVWSITEDRTGNLWVGTGGGGISVLDQSSGNFSQIHHDPEDPTSLGDTDIFSMYEDDSGSIWIGTYGSGLDKYDPITDEFTHFRVSDGLPNNVVYGILEDQLGNLWLSTNVGISQFDPVNETFKNFDVSDGLQSNEFNAGAYLLDREGMMFFGGINGLTSFLPEDIRDTTYMPPVIFTGLKQSGEDLLQEKSVDDIGEVVLNWSNNNLEFEFVALNFSHPEKSRYAYKLVGFDDDWNYIGGSRNGRYTNLPSGSYTLKLKATNSDGLWNEDGASLDVKVVPPFWETWWFIGLVTLIIMGSVVSGYQLRIRSIEARSQELERQVMRRTEEIERRRKEMESLYEADEIIDQNLTQESRLKALVDVSIDLLHADNSAIYVWDKLRERYEVVVSRGFKSTSVEYLSIGITDGYIGEAAQTGEVVFETDLEMEVNSDQKSNEVIDFLRSEGIRSSIYLPIKISNEVFGLFNVNYYEPDSIGEEEIRVFKALTQHSALSIQNAQLFEQLRELAISEERSRLARDLHDSAKQKAFAALAQLGAASGMIDRNPDLSKEHLLEAEDLVYEVLQELIILIQEMYPVALREKGLASSVREYVFDWENQCEIEADLSIQNERRLPLEIEQSVYRVIQESLSNIARHSQAEKVEISLIYDDETLRIEICDDGIGFNVGDQPTGLGLRSMRERIELLKGDMQITSEIGKGTLIKIVAPVNMK